MNYFIDSECLYALLLAIINPKPLSSEQAFAKLKDPNNFFSNHTNAEDIVLLKKAGSSLNEINELLGCKNAQSTYLKYIARRKKKIERRYKKYEK